MGIYTQSSASLSIANAVSISNTISSNPSSISSLSSATKEKQGKEEKEKEPSYWPQKNDLLDFDMHENAFYFDERNKKIYLSFRVCSRILKIDYPSGKVDREYGEKYRKGMSASTEEMTITTSPSASQLSGLFLAAATLVFELFSFIFFS